MPFYEDALTAAEQMRNEENARLIAAAPELLAFIESLTNAVGPYPFLDGTQVVADAYAILCKARGEA